jgi:hypothetical protein
MAIPNLPVWTIRPNWAGGILERLEWLTGVLPSTSGAEQRQSLRVSPRRSVEITVNPTNGERTFLDLILHSMGAATWLFPLWFDKGRLSATAALGQKRINFDNTFREFAVGGLALLYLDTFTYEVVEIAAMDDTGITTVSNLVSPWSKGLAIYPLRKAFLPDETSISALTSRVGESVLMFQINEANDFPEIMPDDLLYQGRPVMQFAPNRKSEVTTDHTRMIDKRDGSTGLVYRADNTGRSFSAQAHNWTIVGREAQSQFRSMLYWLRGRQRSIWLPTFNDDVTLSRPALAGAVTLDINRVGMSYVGGVKPGRNLIRLAGQVVALDDMGAPQSAAEERLHLAAPLPVAVPKGRSGSFMDAARLDSDTLELHHHADTNGALECGTTFRAFKDTRVAAGPIYYPIPAAVMNSTPCGAPPPFWTWHVQFRILADGPKNWAWNPAWCFVLGVFPDGQSYDDEIWTFNWYFTQDYPSGTDASVSVNPQGTFAGATDVQEDPAYPGAIKVEIWAQRQGELLVNRPITGARRVVYTNDLQHFGYSLP